MKTLLSLIFSITVSLSVFSQSFYTETGTAVFHSKVPLHTFSGTSEVLTGLINLTDGTIDFYLDLETLDTGNGKRDKDMKLTLETKKYPFAEFTGKITSDFDVEGESEQEVTVQGVFKIHGEEKEIEVNGTLTPDGENLILKAGWILLLEDYKIEPPKLLFIKVDQEQEIEISAVLKLRN